MNTEPCKKEEFRKSLEEMLKLEVDQAELFVEWLNHLLCEADIRQMVLADFRVDSMSSSQLRGLAWGEALDSRRHHPKTEVKAATYAMLYVGREGDQYVARCVVDL